MSKIVTLQHHQITDLAAEVAHKVGTATFHKRQAGATINLFGIPRGGVPAAYAVAMEYIRTYGWCYVTDDPNEADVFIDDIVDSGATMQRWADKYPGKHFFALVDKTDPALPPELNAWVVFPWETGEDGDAEDNVRRLLQFIGEDPKRGGLLETPKRVIKAWKFWTS
ncbi:MAG: GTP cyclohydrolase I, partial [Planctomycetota bacterium]